MSDEDYLRRLNEEPGPVNGKIPHLREIGVVQLAQIVATLADQMTLAQMLVAADELRQLPGSERDRAYFAKTADDFVAIAMERETS